MDLSSSQQGQMLPPPRRPYKRIPRQEWERQKPHIQALYNRNESMKLKDILQVLKEQHDFDVGERQLKRKLDEWNLSRNIPHRDMRKMVRKRTIREVDAGKQTQFRRRQGASDFQEISQERLDRFQTRFGPGVISTASPSSNFPSDILYLTPSENYRPSPEVNPSPITEEFNNSVETIFETNLEHDEPAQRPNSTSPPLSTRSTPLLSQDPRRCHDLAKAHLFNGNYRAAHDMFDRCRLLYRNSQTRGPNHWVTVMEELNAAMMKAAVFAGSPQNIVARIAQELSNFLIRERQKYTRANPEERDLQGLRKTLTALKLSSKFCSQVIMQQRALEIWEPILGPEHPKIKQMHDNIALKKMSKQRVNLDLEPLLVEYVDTLPEEIIDLDNCPRLASIVDMLHLDDGHPDELRRNLNALENSDALGREKRRQVKLLRYGRSRSLMGMYYSFLGRGDDADKAFRDGNRYMEYESNVEMKLHRTLWFAEHGTRLQDWCVVRKLLCEAHDIYMKNDIPSQFVISHFPKRFEYLAVAISEKIVIDEVMDWWRSDINNINERAISESVPPSIGDDNTNPVLESTPMPGELLFPPTPSGSRFAIDVETWNHFVSFSPNGDSLPATPG
ncbi:hypothetical protein FQN54_008219 [Arachnomyces sp. PD_36]|nr:hypothetical protein FQN54_008219 [Arachnomyces sp. PD_36]